MWYSVISKEVNIKDISSKECAMVLGLSIIKMVECMKETGSTIKWLGKVSYFTNQENWPMKVDGLMTSSKGREYSIINTRSYFISL